MCCSSPFGVSLFPEDVVSGADFQFGVYDMFPEGEGAVGRVGASLEWCSRPFDVERKLGFPGPEME